MLGTFELISIISIFLFLVSPFFIDKQKLKSRSALHLTLFIVSYSQFVMLMHSFPIYQKLKFLTYTDAVLFYLVMPLVYMYVMKLLSNRPVFSARNGINILPATPGFVFVVYFNSLSQADQEHCLIDKHCGMLSDNILYILGLFSQLFYIGLVIYSINKYISKHEQKLSKRAHSMLQQIAWLMYIFVIFGITVSIMVVILPSVDIIHQVNMFMLSLVFFTVYYLAYIQKTEDLSYIAKKTEKKLKTSTEKDCAKYEDIYHQLLCYIQNNRRFLNPALTLKLLSEEMQIPTHKISACIKLKHKTSFPEFINKLRIDYARERLEKSNGEFIKFDFLANECGFGSRSSFYSEFKKTCGMTPSEYKKQLENTMESN